MSDVLHRATQKPGRSLIIILFFNFQDLEKAVVVNIHGSEYVHLSQTCQSLFGPLSHNLLVPEVAVGECIRLLLPVSNPFQTPLLMRKLRLIWKFTDAADPENSYFSNTDLEKAAECVKVEPIERYSIFLSSPIECVAFERLELLKTEIVKTKWGH